MNGKKLVSSLILVSILGNDLCAMNEKGSLEKLLAIVDDKTPERAVIRSNNIRANEEARERKLAEDIANLDRYLWAPRTIKPIGYKHPDDHLALRQKTLLEKFFDYVEHLKITNAVDKSLQRNQMRIPVEPAPAELQQLGFEAQEKVGVLPEDRALITTAPISNKHGYYTCAHAKPGLITVNKDVLNKEGLLARNAARLQVTMLHEANHIKHKDMATHGILVFMALTSVIIATAVLFKFKPLLALVGIPIFGRLVGNTFLAKYKKYGEHRAEIEALYAQNCHDCAHYYVAGDEYHLSERGARIIAQDLEGTQCAWHKDQEKLSTFLKGLSIEESMEYLFLDDASKAKIKAKVLQSN